MVHGSASAVYEMNGEHAYVPANIPQQSKTLTSHKTKFNSATMEERKSYWLVKI